jgi:cytochrome c peroxidase
MIAGDAMRAIGATFLTLAALLLAGATHAACPGYSVCPAVNYPKTLRADIEAKANLAAIDATEQATLKSLKTLHKFEPRFLPTLGQALVFDKTLSAGKNEACAFCHTPAAGFQDGVTAFTPAAGIFPGTYSYRAGFRIPPSLAYSEFAPLLQFHPGTKNTPAEFTGGLFWDDRAAGLVTGDPGSDQAAFPLVNPLEMAFPDPACVVRRIAIGRYAREFVAAWGDITVSWPSDTDKICAQPNNGGANQTPLKLSKSDRVTVAAVIGFVGQNIEEYAQSTLASPFTSKYDAVQAGKAQFTPAEKAGYKLFTGAAHCSLCHGFSLPEGVHTPPLFTDFSARNTGIPHNTEVPYLTENRPDKNGYVANPSGPSFIDEGVGAFLASPLDTNPTFQAQAANFIGTFQAPTLRNVAALPAPGATRTFMHNGFFSSLLLIVHFYNTRDVLPRCIGNTGVGVTCWPAPEVAANETTLIGNLGLSANDEANVVAFLGTLTDGYKP